MAGWIAANGPISVQAVLASIARRADLSEAEGLALEGSSASRSSPRTMPEEGPRGRLQGEARRSSSRGRDPSRAVRRALQRRSGEPWSAMRLAQRVVGLAARRALDLVDERAAGAAPCSRRAWSRQCASSSSSVGARARRASCDDGGDPLAPALVGHADDDDVEHVGVRLQRGLDLFGVDLLAAGVDAHRAAAEQRDACRRPRRRAKSPGIDAALAVDRRRTSPPSSPGPCSSRAGCCRRAPAGRRRPSRAATAFRSSSSTTVSGAACTVGTPPFGASPFATMRDAVDARSRSSRSRRR